MTIKKGAEKERTVRLIAETNDYRVVEKPDDKGKLQYEVRDKRTDKVDIFGSMTEANGHIDKLRG